MTPEATHDASDIPRIPLDLSLGDFIGAMIFCSGTTIVHFAESLDTSAAVISRWMHAINTPTLGKSPALGSLVEIFQLSDNETNTMLENNRSRKTTSTLQQVEGVIGDNEARTAALNILAGYAIRAQQGPPITRTEGGLIRFLLDRTTTSD